MAAITFLRHANEIKRADLELCQRAVENHFLAMDLLRSQYRADKVEKTNETLRRNMLSLTEQFQGELRNWKEQLLLETRARESVSEMCRRLSEERREIEKERAHLIQEIAQRRATRTSDAPEGRKAPHEVLSTSTLCSSPVPAVYKGLRRTRKRRAAKEDNLEKCDQDSVPKRARSEMDSVRRVKAKTSSVPQTSGRREDMPVDILELEDEVPEDIEVTKREVKRRKPKMPSAESDLMKDCEGVQSDRKESGALAGSHDALPYRSRDCPSRLEQQTAEMPETEAQYYHIGGQSTEAADKQMEGHSVDGRAHGGKVKKKARSTVGVTTAHLKRAAKKGTKLVLPVRQNSGDRRRLATRQNTRKAGGTKTVPGVLTKEDLVVMDVDDILECSLQPEAAQQLGLAEDIVQFSGPSGYLPGEVTKRDRKESAATTSKSVTSRARIRKRKAKRESNKVKRPRPFLTVKVPDKEGKDPLAKPAVQLFEQTDLLQDEAVTKATGRGKVLRLRGTTSSAVSSLHEPRKKRVAVRSAQSLLSDMEAELDIEDPLTEKKEQIAAPSDPSNGEVANKSARRRKVTRPPAAAIKTVANLCSSRRHKTEDKLDRSRKEDETPQCILALLEPDTDRETEVLAEEKTQPCGPCHPSHGENARKGKKVTRLRATTKTSAAKQRKQKLDKDGKDTTHSQSLLSVLEPGTEDSLTKENEQCLQPSGPSAGKATRKSGRGRKATSSRATTRTAIATRQAPKRHRAQKELNKNGTRERSPQCLQSGFKPDRETEDLFTAEEVQTTDQTHHSRGDSTTRGRRKKVTIPRTTAKKVIKRKPGKELDKHGQEVGNAQSSLLALESDKETQSPPTDKEVHISQSCDTSHPSPDTKRTLQQSVEGPAVTTRKSVERFLKPRKRRNKTKSKEDREESIITQSLFGEAKPMGRQPAVDDVEVKQLFGIREKEHKTLTDLMEKEDGLGGSKVSKTIKKTPEHHLRSVNHASDLDNQKQENSPKGNETQPPSRITSSSKRVLFSKKRTSAFTLEATCTQSTLSQSRASCRKPLSKSGLFGNPALSQFMRNFRPPQLKKTSQQKT